ncbi:hypothetical protein AB0J72_13675 [Dactylosporangium sp. NPDC049742]|uniref:hypothetical protein n=1 Tax=Dactylosporangium sp. NPDC049742 TaxID=3154737 RepID=UPI0034480229
MDQLDFDDLHDTRATNDEESLHRYVKWSWHKVAMRMVTFAGGVALYLIAVVVVLRAVPGATSADAMKIAGAAIAAGSGGLAVSHLLQRFRRRTPR